MVIDITYDASVSSCPDEAAFKACVAGVVNFYESEFSDPVTINIDVGWGEVDGQALGSDALGESEAFLVGPFSYADIQGALASAAKTRDALNAVASLPATDPTGGGAFYLPTAQAKALGLIGASDAVDGFAGFSSSLPFDFNITTDANASVPAGGYDLFGTVAHEFSEIMGRQMGLGGEINSGTYFTAMDLFDYTAPGTLSFDPTAGGRYFSLNGGVTNLDYFNTDSSGDLFDWAASAGNDSYLAFSNSGVANIVTPTDLRVMDVLGYTPTPNFAASGLSAAGADFSFTVRDISEGAAVASKAGLYLSTTGAISTADTLLATVATPAIASGASVSLGAVVTFSPSLAPGSYFVGAIADYDGAVTEPDTADSVSNAVPIVIVGAANLGAVNGVSGVDAFVPGTLALDAPLTVDGSLTVTGALTTVSTLTLAGSLFTSGTLGGAGTLAIDGGSAQFEAAASLGIGKVTENANASTATFDAANLSYAGLWTQTAGTLAVSAGDRVNFTSRGDSFSGTLAGAGTVAFLGGSDTFTGAHLTAASIIVDGPVVTLGGATTLTGTLAATTDNLVIAAGGASLGGGGSLIFDDLSTNRVHGGALTNINDFIKGAGLLGDGVMVLVNDKGGVIDGDNTVALTINTGSSVIANAGTIEATSKGTTTVMSAVDNTGVLAALGGNLTVEKAVTGTGKVEIDAAVADFASTFSQNVAFLGTGGALELAHSETYTGRIIGFSRTGATSLDLGDIPFVSGTTTASYSGTISSGVLTIAEGSHIAAITLEGNYLRSTFTASSDSHGGTTIVDPTAPAPAVSQSTAQFVAAIATFAAPAALAAHQGPEPPGPWQAMLLTSRMTQAA